MTQKEIEEKANEAQKHIIAAINALQSLHFNEELTDNRRRSVEKEHYAIYNSIIYLNKAYIDLNTII